MSQRLFTPAVVAAMFLGLLAFLAGAPPVGAQATPGLQDPEGEPEIPGAYPTHIHEGTCADTGEILYPLDDVPPVDATPGDTAASQMADTDSTPIALEVTTRTPVVVGATVEATAPLTDLIAVPTVLDVHMSGEDGEVIACGAISGSPEDGRLRVVLEEVNDSGIRGDALLTEGEQQSTTITITLHRTGDGAVGTPQATPTD